MAVSFTNMEGLKTKGRRGEGKETIVEGKGSNGEGGVRLNVSLENNL